MIFRFKWLDPAPHRPYHFNLQPQSRMPEKEATAREKNQFAA